jgi:hypothetical protein
MHRRPNIAGRQINHQIRLLRVLIRVINTREALDLASARLGINTALIRLLGVLQRRSNVDEVEGSVLLDRLAGSLPVFLERRNGRDNGRGTCFGELRGDEGNAGDVLVAVGAREAEFAGEFAADCVAEEEGDGAAALLVQSDI